MAAGEHGLLLSASGQYLANDIATQPFKRHHVPPLGAISRYRPPPSKSLLGFSLGRALRIAVALAVAVAVAVRGVLGRNSLKG